MDGMVSHNTSLYSVIGCINPRGLKSPWIVSPTSPMQMGILDYLPVCLDPPVEVLLAPPILTKVVQ